MTASMPSCLILGAGISGLTLGWKLAAAGLKTVILESDSSAGGLAGTLREDGYCLDFGPHSFFSENEEIRHMVLDLFNKRLEARSRHVKFCYRNRLLDYPITASSVLRQMGLGSTIASIRDFIFAKMSPPKTSLNDDDLSVEDWALSNFGPHLYRTFFKPYTEQFWQIPCRELSARSIPTHTRLSFANTLRFLMKARTSSSSASQIERENLPTYYPPTGYAEIAERLASKFLAAGGSLRFSSKVFAVERRDSAPVKISFTSKGENLEIAADIVVSTLPLPLFTAMIKPSLDENILASASKLDFRPLLVLGIGTSKQNVLSADYIYLLDRPYNRIVEMNKFSTETSPPGKNIIAVEIPCLRNLPVWEEGKEKLFERCIPSLESDNILKREDAERLFLVKAAYAYPIYRKGYAAHLKQVLNCLEKIPRVFTLGRGGEFRYMDADQCMKRALDLSQKILSQIDSEPKEGIRI